MSIKKDDRCVQNGEVYEDWGVMLNQTNVGNNNNKYYVIQLIKSGNNYFVYTRWGRVGMYSLFSFEFIFAHPL